MDKPASTEPAVKIIAIDMLWNSIDYQSEERLLPLLKETAKLNFHISNIGHEPVLESGEISTSGIGKRNMDPVKLPKSFGNVLHFNIGYGCK